MQLQVGVKILLRNKQGEYLLVRRSSDKYPDASGSWDIVGGRITPGSTLFENLQREVKEETSLGLVKEPKLIAAQDILRVKDTHIVRLTYVGDIEGEGEVKLDEENTEFKWLSIENMKAMSDLGKYIKEVLDNTDL